MRRLVPARIIAIGLFAITLSCGSSTGPDPKLAEVAGRYTLRSIDGAPLPAVVGSSWVLELTLTLTDEGRIILNGFNFPTNGAPSGPAPAPTFRQDVHAGGSFTRVGNTISFTASPYTSYLELGTAPFAGNDTLVISANAGSIVQPQFYNYLYVREEL